MATSRTAGTTRRLARATLLALAASVLPAAAGAQASPFAASPLVFPATGANEISTRTVAITLTAPTKIASISIPINFKSFADFQFISQTGCVVDGVTVNPSGTVCSVKVKFLPYYPGARSGSLVLVDGTGTPYSIGLSGTAYTGQPAFSPAAAMVVAGLGPASSGYAGDGDSAILAALSAPTGVASDRFGNIFFSDTGNNVVRMLDAFGNITTIAGGGTLAGAAADGGLATAAALNQPTFLALDPSGNLYIAESGSNVIRKVALPTTRLISTVAGNYVGGFSDGPALSSQLSGPQGITVDAYGNLDIADSGNQRIRRYDATAQTLTTIAGSGTPGFDTSSTSALSAHFNAPAGIALDLTGNLYIADSGNHAIRELTGGNVLLVAGTGVSSNSGDGGSALAATLIAPSGIALNAAGDIYVADYGASRVRRVELSTGLITTVLGQAKGAGYTAGVSPSTDTKLNSPVGLVFDPNQNLYVADSANNVMRLLAPTPGEVQFPNIAAGNSSSAYSFLISNIGNGDLSLSSILAANSGTSGNFTISANTCGSVLAAGTGCTVSLIYSPVVGGFNAGEIDVTDVPTPSNRQPATQPVYLLGGVSPTLTIGPATLPQVVANHHYSQTVTASGGFGTVTVQESGTLPDGITASVSGAILTLSGTPTASGSFPIVVYATDMLGQSVAQSYMLKVLPALITFSLTEGIGVADLQTHLSQVNLSIIEGIGTSDTQSHLSQINLSIVEGIGTTDGQAHLSGVLLTPGESVKIGDTVAFTLSAALTLSPASGVLPGGTAGVGYPFTAITASGGTGSITYKTAGTVPGMTFTAGTSSITLAGTPTAAGSYTLQATATDSNGATSTATYFLSIAKATLMLTANNASRVYDTVNPAFSYQATGFINGDNASVITGVPRYQTVATGISPIGTYPIVISLGTLAASNYNFTFQPGTLTVTGAATQTIRFAALPNLRVGSAMLLTATATSGLPVSYTVSGPCKLSGNTLTITGSGTVTVTALQAGNNFYAAAPNVARSVTIP